MNILLDQDGVLSDFLGGAIKVCNDLTGKNYTTEEYASTYGKWGIDKFYGIPIDEMWSAIEDTENFWYNLDVLPWAKELYEWLSEIGTVTIVTSPPLMTECATQKMNWLRFHMNIEPPEVFVGSRKYLMAGNGILIDDWEVNVEKFRSAGGEAVLVPSNWNTVGLTIDYMKKSIGLWFNYDDLSDELKCK